MRVFIIIFLLLSGLTGMLSGQTVRETGIRETGTDSSRKKKEPWPIIPAARKMVEEELLPQGNLNNDAVLDAVMRVPREKFVPPVHRNMAYRDTALPIGNAQTISPPYIVTYMTEKLDPQPDDKVLEIGTGSGYQAAVLGLLVQEVYSIEIVEPLGKRAAQTLKKIGYKNVFTKIGDGYQGWPDTAPFDKIIVTCSPESVPQPLVDQLKDGGLMIIPIGERYQQHFQLLRKKGTELEKESLTPALFVPMTGEAESNRVVLPDAKNPSIVGGDFEQTSETGHPIGWHYARNATVMDDPQSQSGMRFIRFEIPAEPRFQFPDTSWQPQPLPQATQLPTPQPMTPQAVGKDDSRELKVAQVIQGFAVDGKSVSRLKVEAFVRANNVLPLDLRQKPGGTIQIHFYDDDRDMIQQLELAPVVGTFEWKKFATEIPVPKKAKEAILFLGLFHTSGTLDMDAVTIRK